jgi:anti-repressor protein
MSEIKLLSVDNVLVVDSRIIAEQLEIEHRSYFKLILTHQVRLEAKFGSVRFEIAVASRANPSPQKYALLTEDRALAILSLSRNI